MEQNATASREVENLDVVRAALAPICGAMEVDGYRLTLDNIDGETLRATVVATEGACTECLAPKHVLELILLGRLPNGSGVQAVELTYPADTHDLKESSRMPDDETFDKFVDVVDRYVEDGYTDGLPVIPPTEKAVADMIAACSRSADDVVGEAMWRDGPVTVHDVAINAVLAGCRPEDFSVVLAAMDSIVMEGPQWIVSTAAFAPLILLNGPVRERLGINTRMSVMGPGTRANATIGRAVHLCLINLWQAKIGLYDRATMGSAYRYGWVIGEDEENSPWQPFHVDKGFGISDSAAFIACSWHPFEINHLEAREPETVLGPIVEFFSLSTQFNAPFNREDESLYERVGRRAVVLLGEDHRNHIAGAGWSKRDVSEYIVKHSGRRVGDVRALGFTGDRLFPRTAADGEWAPVFDTADDLMVLSAGGPGGHSSVAKITWSHHQLLP